MQRLFSAPRTTTTLVGLALLTSGAAFSSSAAIAAPTSPSSTQPSASSAITAETVQYRGDRWHHGHRHWRGHGYRGYRHWGSGPRYRYYGYGPGIAAGVAAIIGGSIVASQRDHGDAWQRCDERYNSFRWSDGTFQPYGDGPRQLCPYLRD